ncbi:protein ENHANCED DOWNY MILDEW 2-like isoform X2 [Rosa rugosa]|uniref:protein ENHANCED DOWNY MILDEW 2-like isoform X2 n=1 Tax=Rosa rugosa TaxID=74645 RepID=UPI002B411983|nr:protein ENHANCED DOWNY MILDEW 2-like isoform X2 [Rosa rugosa]
MEPANNSPGIREEGELSPDDADDIQVTKRLKSVVDDTIGDAEDGFVDIDYMFSYVCALCHDGGDLLCCEGRCLRSFHATPETGQDSGCVSLGFTKDAVDAMPNFLCQNCKYKQHQCFVCGELGSSDKSSGAAEVVPCVSPVCGQFYHPHCVAKELSQDNGVPAEELEKKITMGESFTCPVHKCRICKQGENIKDHGLQFAVCMLCPKSYHRKCLPSFIPFEDKEGTCGEGKLVTRAWDGIMPNRILIYCIKHEEDKTTKLFVRDHIKFPAVKEKRKLTPQSIVDREQVASMMINPSLEESYRERTANTEFKQKEKPSFARKRGNLDAPNTDTKRRILGLMEKAASSITLKDILRKYPVPSHTYSMKNVVDTKMSLGKVEVSIEAARTALRKLDEGCSTKDAEAVCGPEVLKQIFRWKTKMNVYLGPFLHGMRYTSFGRHFTNVEKLKQIVDKLHWYVKTGDMIVDFCCGANDFSVIMKKKLEETGKNCYYKNYDLFQAKNDFNFEKKDWMTVQREELPVGSRLIMGLNPPFGVKASRANQFIDKALGFNPKLLILIVPSETQRLDQKTSPYDLIWENPQLLSGKSFYLPGSVDVNGKHIDQHNVIPPPLYLWSRPDWSSEHYAIAQEHGHISIPQSATVENTSTHFQGRIRVHRNVA